MERRTPEQIAELITEPSHRAYFIKRNVTSKVIVDRFVLLGKSKTMAERGMTLLISSQNTDQRIEFAKRNWSGETMNLVTYEVLSAEEMALASCGEHLNPESDA